MTQEWETGRFSAGVRVHLIHLQSEWLPKLIHPLPLRWPLFSVYIPCMLVTLWIVIKGILGLLVPHPRKTGCHVTKAVLGKGRLIPNRQWRRPARHDVSLPMNSGVNTHSAKSQPLCVHCVLSITPVQHCCFPSVALEDELGPVGMEVPGDLPGGRWFLSRCHFFKTASANSSDSCFFSPQRL